MNLRIWNRLTGENQIKIWEYWIEQYNIRTGNKIEVKVL